MFGGVTVNGIIVTPLISKKEIIMDFEQYPIDIRYYTEDFGEYKFSFPANSSANSYDGVMPFGTSIASGQLKVFLGLVNSGSNLANYEDITNKIIDQDNPPVFNSDSVIVRFDYPGEEYKNKKATLVFELNLTNGGKYPFYFHYLAIGAK
jgi:hypothetical protein